MRIGIDLGGTKIAAIALDAGGREVWTGRVKTPAGDYSATIARIAELVRQADSALGGRGSVGIGIPGTISPRTGLVKNANSVHLIGHRLDHDLARALDRPVRLANDADCFALSEATDGAAAGARSVFGVILGTGTGGGLVSGGTLVQGINAVAGEWGHNPLPWPRLWTLDDGRQIDERPGADCYCGLKGCIETFLSGPGMSREHEALTGRALSPEAIDREAASGGREAAATMERYVDRLARALTGVINIVDPEVIVLGGGLSQIDRLYEAVPARWTSWVFSDHVATRLVRPKFGDASGVRGAAWLWPG